MANLTKIDLGKIVGETGVGIQNIEKRNYTNPDNPLIDYYDITLTDGTIHTFTVTNATEITPVSVIDLDHLDSIPNVEAILNYFGMFYNKTDIDNNFQEKNLIQNMNNYAQSTSKYPSVKAVEDYCANFSVNVPEVDLSGYYTKAEIDNMIGEIQSYIYG